MPDDNSVIPSNDNYGNEPQIPKSRFDQALKLERDRISALEEENRNLRNSQHPTNDNDNVDVERIAEFLVPALTKKGFLTREQQESENNAREYTSQLKNLQTKYDGNDGRPVFDPFEIAEYSRETKIFDLEAAYERKYKKELFDWEINKQNGGSNNTDIETEKPGEKVNNNGENSNLLTREAIAKKLAGPGGEEWWEKNREVYLKAAEKGEISQS